MEPHNLSSGSHPPHVTDDNLPYTCTINMASSNTSALADMLSKIDELDVIPKLQVEAYSHVTGQKMGVVSETVQEVTPPIQQDSSSLLPVPVSVVEVPSTIVTVSDSTPTIIPSNPSISDVLSSILQQASDQEVSVQSTNDKPDKKKPRVGRPRTKPQKEKAEWHYHLGGMRHSRTPLSPELREVLEVAYVSKIMSKNFRKEGQPEKERIANITGMDLEKVQEWFKNRRKKDKLQTKRRYSSGKQTSKTGDKSSNKPITNEHTSSLQTTPTVEIQTSAVIVTSGSELPPTSCEVELYN